MRKIKIISVIVVFAVGGILSACGSKDTPDGLKVNKVDATEAYADAQKVQGKGSDFEYTVNSDGATITLYKGKDTEVVIPDEIDGNVVIGIDINAFVSDKVTKITLPKGLVEIKTVNFSKCTNLNELILNDGLVTIEYCAFTDCNNLKELYIPSSVTDITYSSFPDPTITKIYVQTADDQAAIVAAQNLIAYEVKE